MGLREHVPLAPMTTIGLGGPARYFFEARDEESVSRALAWAHARGIDVVVLGGGSNVVIADRGLDALVLRVDVRGVDVHLRDEAIVDAGAGEPWDALVERAVASGWAGVECLSGIPGAVGATPIQNVGAYGQEVSETIREVRVVLRRDGSAAKLDTKMCAFGYRDSVFKREARGAYVVVGVRFALRPGGRPSVRYPELARRLADVPTPTLGDVRSAVVTLRRSKSMVLDEADENRQSVGSFFVNPTIPEDAAADVRARVARLGLLARGERMPEFPTPDGRVKLSAAWLIERSGFAKGTRDGAVGISTRHSLAIVNRGGASAASVIAFAARVRRGVHGRFGVTLAPEAQLLGFEAPELGALVDAIG